MGAQWVSEFTVPADDSGGTCGISFEDRGHNAIMYDPAMKPAPVVLAGDDGQFTVRFLSGWEDDDVKTEDRHKLFRTLMGKRVRVTVEVIDP